MTEPAERYAWADPLLYGAAAFGEPLPEERGVRFGLGAPLAASCALASQLTQVDLTRSLLDDRTSWLSVGHRPAP